MTAIIAEIGINHNGSVKIAKQLIDMAHDCGCDAVKFQKRTIEIVYSPEELAKPRESPWGTTNGDQKRGLEFGQDEYDEIDEYCRKVGIPWFASAWDLPSLEFLRQYDCPMNKVASAMLAHATFVDAVIAERKETLVSTGMDLFPTVRRVAQKFQNACCPFALLHCVALYPCPTEQLNLMRIEALRQIHPRVGYSGHEVGLSPSIFAAARGIEYVERHITLDRSMYGSDQSASIEKPGLERLVQMIRENEKGSGDGADRIAVGVTAVAQKLRYW